MLNFVLVTKYAHRPCNCEELHFLSTLRTVWSLKKLTVLVDVPVLFDASRVWQNIKEIVLDGDKDVSTALMAITVTLFL